MDKRIQHVVSDIVVLPISSSKAYQISGDIKKPSSLVVYHVMKVETVKEHFAKSRNNEANV